MIFRGNFANLPEDLPYGFWIAPDGSFTTVAVYCHTFIISEIIPGIDHKNCVDLPLQMGYIMCNSGRDIRVDKNNRLVLGDETIGIKYDYRKTTSKALKTLKDLAAFYKVPLYRCHFHN